MTTAIKAERTSRRLEQIRVFLNSGIWQVAEDREHTRRALSEFLAELPDEEFEEATDDPAVFVLATAAYRVATSVPWGIVLTNIPAGCETFDRRFQVVHLDPKIEQYKYAEVRAIVVEAMTYALATVNGMGEGRALRLAESARRTAQRRGHVSVN